ncbi:transcriptional regulator with XRE-family HTH domain [Desulfohalotomaculum tongense]|uniref:helix-turn-helix domain-containing protein n=1 Tax=Desulforadius tongensis TaxID=1216062 RepID=UPI00195EC900|nr:helix-turn-helix domain-containing protein [Desulforadius tongensis]MBM7856176.1 transcriptional regulator with XRE-family HTH domain [Desulforadius tongensis]
MDIGKRIKNIRQQQGLSMNELARRAQVAQSNLSYIESGQRQPTFDLIQRICNGLGLTVPEFFNMDYQPNPISSDFNNLLDKTKNLRPSQQQAIKNILSAVENVAEEFSLSNQLKNTIKSTNNKCNYVEILDLLDKENINLTAGGRPLTLEERVQILELLKEKILSDDEQAATSSDTTIAASHQGDSLIQDPSPDDADDIKKAIKYAEQQEMKRKK